MKELIIFFQNFLTNKGQLVFISLLIAKICGFLNSWLIIRLLPVSDFGILTIVAAVFALFSAVNGLGSHQSLLRFGSISHNEIEKTSLSNLLFYNGLRYQIMISVLFFCSSFFFLDQFSEIVSVFLFFTIRLMGFYFFNHVQAYFRIVGKNGSFSAVNNVVNISGVVLLFLFTNWYGFTGYLISMAVAPFISLFWLNQVPLKKIKQRINFTIKELFSYGIFASGAALVSDLLFSADILLLGFFTDENAVANYKTAILLPANITFLAIVFMQTDFPQLAKNYKDKIFLKNYIFNYYKIFVPLCIFIFLLGSYFSEPILHLFFGDKYDHNGMLFIILLFGFVINMLLRNLYGNLLSAVGKIKINSYISILSLLILVISSSLLVPKYQILGMALSLTLTMISTGAVFALMFFLYYRRLK